MKKYTLLLMIPVLTGLLMSCGKKNSSSETSSEETSSQETSSQETSSQETSSQESSSGTSSTTSSSSSLPDEEKQQTYNFYLDYSHSDSVFYTMKWWNGYPLGECPAECQLDSDDAPDEAYPTFLGWSKYSSAIDEEQLWDFATDASLNKTVNLYGIWVSA